MKERLLGVVKGPLGAVRRLGRKLAAREVTQVRRIERVFPPPGERVVAMTFDDGPTASAARPGAGQGLTSLLLASMARYGARGTFNIIGSTAQNYPDEVGPTGTFLWSGVAYDHYPEFGRDQLAGAANQPRLVEELLAAGHELANHSYRHLGFGPVKVVYGTRAYFPDLEAVLEDQWRLHELVRRDFGYEMSLARPPHYIDRIAGGHTAYDAYLQLGYQYLAASFDGGGWQPSSGDYEADVRDMVAPLREALQRDPDSLSGQVVFQKDGYNMSGQSPVADALPLQLDLLYGHGYRVVTVSELLSMSPFVDADPRRDWFEPMLELLGAGYRLGFRDNTLRPDAPLTWGQLSCMLADPATPLVSAAAALASAQRTGLIPAGVRSGTRIGPDQLAGVLSCLRPGLDPGTVAGASKLTRGPALKLLATALSPRSQPHDGPGR